MRRAAKVDRNQPAIVAALRAVGASVQSLAALGSGVPDLLIAFRGSLFLFEIKDPAKPPSARQLTADQIEWHSAWQSLVHVVQTPEQALKIIGAVS